MLFELVIKRFWSKKYLIKIVFVIVGKKIKVKDLEILDVDFGFELITEEKCDEDVVYLFVRISRDKEIWFKRFVVVVDGIFMKNLIG